MMYVSQVSTARNMRSYFHCFSLKQRQWYSRRCDVINFITLYNIRVHYLVVRSARVQKAPEKYLIIETVMTIRSD